MKYGLSKEVYEKIKKVIENNKKYKIVLLSKITRHLLHKPKPKGKIFLNC